MGTRENKFQSSETSCANTGKILSSVSFHQYFQVFHTKFNIRFRRLVLLEMICFEKIFKAVVQSLQYDVNNLGTRFLPTYYKNFCWIPSFNTFVLFLPSIWSAEGKSDPLSKVGYSFSRYLQLTVLFAFCPTEGWDWIDNIYSSELNVSPLLDLKSYHHLLADS